MKLMSRVSIAVISGMLLLHSPVHAQATPPTAYDVSTVRAAAPGENGMSINWGSTEMKATNATLVWLLPFALHVRADQITGLPTWAKEKHFDITAKLTDTDKATLEKMTPDQQRALIVALLAERFGLKYHLDTKDLPTYDLVPAKGGLKLTAAAFSGDKTKQVFGTCSGCTSGYNTEMKGHDIEMSAFVEILAAQLERSIHDETGYTGKIDYDLKWAPDLEAKASDEQDTSLPPLPKALEQQMGLHLVPSHGPVKLYVIDHLEEPTAN